MKLFALDHSEMLDISKIEADGVTLRISGTMMGAMPVQVILTGSELRKLFLLLSGRVILTAIRMLFTE